MEDLNDKVSNGGASAAGKLASGEWNEVASEVQNVITASGLALSAGDLTQLLIAVTKIAAGQGQWCNDSGSATAYVLTPLYTVATPLFTGLTLCFRPANNNSGAAPTVNYNGTGVKTIKNESGGDIVAGDLSTLRDAQIRYDGTYFRLLTNSTNLILNNLYKKGYIHGFQMYCDPGTSDYRLGLFAGECANSLGDLNLVLGSGMAKEINVNWTAGNGGGAKPTAFALSNNSFYRVFIIGGASASIDWGIDTSSSATNLMSTASTVSGNTYNKQRQIGWIRTDGSAKLVQFYQAANDLETCWYMTPYLNISGGGGTNNITETQQVLTVDAPVLTTAILAVSVNVDPSGGTDTWYLDIRATAMDDIAASQTNNVIAIEGIGGGDAANSVIVEVESDGSRQIAYRGESTAALNQFKYTIATRGFRYNRGAQ